MCASRPTKLDAYKPCLDQRWQEGCTHAWNLWEEIREQGYPDGYGNVPRYVSSVLRGKPQPLGPRPPSAHAVTRWILTHPDALPEGDRLRLKAVPANRPELDALARHVRSFGHMLTHLQGDPLPGWIEAATATDLPSLQRFAQHLARDLDAVNPACHSLGTPASWKAMSTGSRCSNATGSTARDPNFSANESCWCDRASRPCKK